MDVCPDVLIGPCRQGTAYRIQVHFQQQTTSGQTTPKTLLVIRDQMDIGGLRYDVNPVTNRKCECMEHEFIQGNLPCMYSNDKILWQRDIVIL